MFNRKFKCNHVNVKNMGVICSMYAWKEISPIHKTGGISWNIPALS